MYHIDNNEEKKAERKKLSKNDAVWHMYYKWNALRKTTSI